MKRCHTATVPVGTLWIFGSQPQDFSDEQVNLIEIVAGRLAAELEREILLRQRIGNDVDGPTSSKKSPLRNNNAGGAGRFS